MPTSTVLAVVPPLQLGVAPAAGRVAIVRASSAQASSAALIQATRSGYPTPWVTPTSPASKTAGSVANNPTNGS